MRLLVSLLVAFSFIIGLLVGSQYSNKHKVVERVVVTDTVKVASFHHPVEVSRKVVTVRIPTLVFPPDVAASKTDSLPIEVPVVDVEYSDSTYKAVVSGPSVGDQSPVLKELEIYNKTVTETIIKKPPTFVPYVSGSIGYNIMGVDIGVVIKGKHGAGVGVYNVNGSSYPFGRYTYYF